MKRLKHTYSFTTQRLIIRFYQEEDFLKWQKLFSDMAPKQSRWDWEGENLETLTKERFNNKLKKHQKERDNANIYYFCVEDKNQNLIGICLITEIKDLNHPFIEIGFQLNNRYWGKGLGTEFAQGVVEICKEEFRNSDVRALVNKKNFPSIHILEKIGMKKVNENETQWMFE